MDTMNKMVRAASCLKEPSLLMLYQFDVNVLGVVRTINTFLPLLREGAAKKVITLGSGVGDYKFTLLSEDPTAVPYSVSKAAVVMVVAKYAMKYKKEGFVFVTISPGLVDTQPANSERQYAFPLNYNQRILHVLS